MVSAVLGFEQFDRLKERDQSRTAGGKTRQQQHYFKDVHGKKRLVDREKMKVF